MSDGERKYSEGIPLGGVEMERRYHMGLLSKLFGREEKVPSRDATRVSDVICPHCRRIMWTAAQIGEVFRPFGGLRADNFSANVLGFQLEAFLERPCDSCLRRMTRDQWLIAAPWLRGLIGGE